MAGTTLAFDTRIVRVFRQAGDPASPIGPRWIESTLIDLTALGGPTVLGLVVAAVAGFLLLQGRYRSALVILIAAATGELLNGALKSLLLRPRPDIVPHLRIVYDTSFPSGHALLSTVFYVTLGAMLARTLKTRAQKVYALGVGLLLAMLVGASRVYLGVHWASDVLAGWCVGAAWAMACWLLEWAVERKARAIPSPGTPAESG